MTTAFAYLRVSGKGQIDGDGYPRQLAAIESFAAAHGIEIKQVFREEGVSGTKELDDRPALMELLEALAANGTRTILIEKLDRLARDYFVQELLLRDFKKRGYTLISVMEPDLTDDDPNNPTRKFIRTVMGALGEYDKSLVVLKLRGARQRKKARTGRCEGQKPYGHYPGEKEILEDILDYRRAGWSVDAIAASLNEEGLKPRRGKLWYGSTVGRIVGRASA